MNKVLKNIASQFKAWREEINDRDIEDDEIHNFVNRLSRFEMSQVMYFIESEAQNADDRRQ